MLRLPTIRSHFPELAETASRERMSYLGFLSELLLAECDDRARRRSAPHQGRRLPQGEVPAGIRLRRQPRHRPGRGPPPRQLRMEGAAALPHRRLRHRQVPPADRARHRGRDGRLRVKYVLAAKLVNELVEAADEK